MVELLSTVRPRQLTKERHVAGKTTSTQSHRYDRESNIVADVRPPLTWFRN